MKKRGRRHTPGEEHLMRAGCQGVYGKDRTEKGGARKAASDLGNQSCVVLQICLQDKDLPRMEVLRHAQEKWKGVKWDLIDVSQITKKKKITSPEQYVLVISPRGPDAGCGDCQNRTEGRTCPTSFAEHTRIPG